MYGYRPPPLKLSRWLCRWFLYYIQQKQIIERTLPLNIPAQWAHVMNNWVPGWSHPAVVCVFRWLNAAWRIELLPIRFNMYTRLSFPVLMKSTVLAVLMLCCLNQLLEHGTDCTTNHCSQIKKRLNDVNNCTYIEVCLETGESVNQMFQLGT